MEEHECLKTDSDPLMACCLCKNLLHDPLQLTCLHNCCRVCFTAAASEKKEGDVACGTCGATTRAGSELPNSFVDHHVQRNSAIVESRTCGVCKENGELAQTAVAWCASCRNSLCSNCLEVHRQYYKKHITAFLEELKSLEDLCAESSTTICPTHQRPLEIACINCEQAKCLNCWTECSKEKHEMLVLGHSSFDDYVKKFVALLSSEESELLKKSEVLEKPKVALADVREARARHLEQIQKRKRLIVDAVEEAYEEIESSVKNTYDDMEKTAEGASAVAACITSNLSDARSYIRRLIASNRNCEILNQQKAVRKRLKVLSAELDAMNATLGTIREVNVDSSMPSNVVNVVKTWLGMPLLHSALAQSLPPQRLPPQLCSFGKASASVRLPCECYDVAVTKEGRLLLAAAEHGLLAFCSSSGRELSRWVPSKFDHRQEEVQTVAALSDGRAAAGLYLGQVVVLLKLNESLAWTVNYSLQPMQWRPKRLSAHGEALGVAEYGSTDTSRLLLTSARSSWRQPSFEQSRNYAIGGLAITARAVVTASSYPVKLTSDREAHVLEAYSLAKISVRLWRNDQFSNDEHLQGICANSIGSILYAAFSKLDDGGGRVSTIDMVDGSELQHITVSFDAGSLLLPRLLALTDRQGRPPPQSQQQPSENSDANSNSSFLAVLCWDPESGQQRTVTLHRSS